MWAAIHSLYQVGGRERESGVYLDHGLCDMVRVQNDKTRRDLSCLLPLLNLQMEKLRSREGRGSLEINSFALVLLNCLDLSGLQQSPGVCGFVCCALSGLMCEGPHLAEKGSEAQ